jgi:DNA-binding MarR family transcriptional regulator
MSSRSDAVHTINSAITQLMRRIRRIDEAQGIGRARLSALAVLHFGGPGSLSALAQTEMVSRATMHHVINGLVRDGLATRSTDPDDARRQVIALTPRGRKLITRAHRDRLDYLKGLAGAIPARDLAVTARTLDRLRDAARQA